MKILIDAFLKELNTTFTNNKVKDDFILYISTDEDVMVEAYDSKNDTIREVTINSNDEITVISKRIIDTIPDVICYKLDILIGIGNFRIKNGIYKVSKCLAILHYNENIELVNVDFIYEDINITN